MLISSQNLLDLTSQRPQSRNNEPIEPVDKNISKMLASESDLRRQDSRVKSSLQISDGNLFKKQEQKVIKVNVVSNNQSLKSKDSGLNSQFDTSQLHENRSPQGKAPTKGKKRVNKRHRLKLEKIRTVATEALLLIEQKEFARREDKDMKPNPRAKPGFAQGLKADHEPAFRQRKA